MKNRLFVFKLFCLLSISILLFSCVPLKKIRYFQDKEGVAPVSEFQIPQPEYVLQPGDNLYIRILSLDQKSNEDFSNITGSSSTSGNYVTEQTLYLTSYMVNDSGYIVFPLLGSIRASGLTLSELERSISNSTGAMIKEASIIVKLVLFNVSVIGEVGAPGRYPIYNNKANIFEVLAMARDLTTFANRNKVQIIRNEGGKNTIITLDLTSKDILKSPYFYLEPNDIIYAEPLSHKSFSFETFPYSLIVSTLTTLIVIATYFKK